MINADFRYNWPGDSEEVENVKVEQTDGQTDDQNSSLEISPQVS